MTRATVPLPRHREVREKLAAAQTELRRAESQRDQYAAQLSQLGSQLGPMADQMARLVGENRALKMMIVKIYQQAKEAGAELPKLETFQSIPEGMGGDGTSQAGQVASRPAGH